MMQEAAVTVRRRNRLPRQRERLNPFPTLPMIAIRDTHGSAGREFILTTRMSSMKRIVLALALALSFAAPAFAEPSANLAPADRYFGRLKMSILGVRNSIKDLSAR